MLKEDHVCIMSLILYSIDTKYYVLYFYLFIPILTGRKMSWVWLHLIKDQIKYGSLMPLVSIYTYR